MTPSAVIPTVMLALATVPIYLLRGMILDRDRKIEALEAKCLQLMRERNEAREDCDSVLQRLSKYVRPHDAKGRFVKKEEEPAKPIVFE